VARRRLVRTEVVKRLTKPMSGAPMTGSEVLANQVKRRFSAGSHWAFPPLAALVLAMLGTMLVAIWSDNREHRRLRELVAADSAAVVTSQRGDDTSPTVVSEWLGDSLRARFFAA